MNNFKNKKTITFKLERMSRFLSQLVLGGLVGGTISYTLGREIRTSTESISSELKNLVENLNQTPASLEVTSNRLAMKEHVKSRVS